MTVAMRDAWADTLRDLARDDPDLLVLDGDLGTSTRADRFAAAYPDRFLQMGIAEQNMVGVAVGLATLGYVPWLSSFGVFFTHRAVDQVRMLVAQTHANVKIGAAYTGLLTGFTGKTHQDVEDLAIMRAMPGMTVIAPGDATECVAAVRWATGMHGPVYLRLARDAGPDLFDDGYRFEPGRVDPAARGFGRAHRLDRHADRPVRRGRRAARRVGGFRGRPARAVDQAGRRGRPSRRRLGPFRSSSRSRSTRSYGGLGGLVAEILSEREPRRVVRIGIADTWGESAPNAFLLERHGLSAERVAERVTTELRGTPEALPATER